MFTRLTIPVIDLQRASQESCWYSGLDLSKDAASCIARKQAGDIYVPPERVFKSFANSSRWADPVKFAETLQTLANKSIERRVGQFLGTTWTFNDHVDEFNLDGTN